MFAFRPYRSVQVLIALLAVAATASAQFEFIPYSSEKGLDLAAEYAATHLPAGARLVLIGAVGEARINGMPVRIDPATGEASVWAYIVHVPSTNVWRSLAVVDIAGMGASVFETDPPVAIPTDLTDTLELAGRYASSAAMAAKLGDDPMFAAFSARTGMRPSLASLRPAAAQDSAALPPGFPLDAPVWSLVFGKQDSAALYCWVASGTGEVHVLDPRISAVPERVKKIDGSLDVTVTPNPSRSNVVAHVADAGGASLRVTLHTADGATVNAIAVVSRTANGWRAELDMSGCASGTYLLKVVGAGGEATRVIRHVASGS